MAFLEISKSGKLVRRLAGEYRGPEGRPVFKLVTGEVIELEPGKLVRRGAFEFRVVEGDPPASPTAPSVSDTTTAVGFDLAGNRDSGRTVTSGDTGRPAQRTPGTISDTGSVVADASSGSFPEIEGYRITAPLGEGAMGTVWRAEHLSTHQEVAIKLMSAAVFGSEKARLRFEREVELAARLKHPNIARVYDSGIHRGVYFYAMELVEGVRLDDYVRCNKLARRDVMRLMRTVSEAVQHAHRHGVIHRDLKPANILVTGDGTPFVLDFGLARVSAEGQDAHVSAHTREGDLAGTIPYMSPEQAAGKIDLNTRTDVYALGVILYELLLNRLPRDMSGGTWSVLRRLPEQEVIRPTAVDRRLDGELESLLLKALALCQAERYESAGDLADDIDNYLEGEPLSAKRPTTWYFLRKKVKKYRGRVAVAAAFILTLIGMAVFSYVRVTRERNRAVAAEKEATKQRTIAERERDSAEEQRRKAVAAKNAEARQRKRAEKETYRYAIAEADRLSRRHTFAEARTVLETTNPRLRGFAYGHLLCRSKMRDITRLQTLEGPSNTVHALAFSPDGTRLATGTEDEAVTLWDMTAGREIATLRHPGTVKTVAFSPDGRHLASGSSGSFKEGAENIVKLWDVTAATAVRTMRGHTDPVNAVAFSPDGRRLASGSWDKTVKIWDVNSGKELQTLAGHSYGVFSVSFSPDGGHLASGSFDDTIMLWDTVTGRKTAVLRGHTGGVRCLAFSPDGKRLASGSADGTVKLWNPVAGREIMTLRGHGNTVLSVAFSPGGERLASGGEDATIRFWDTATGEELTTLTGHTDSVNAVAFAPDGNRLASGSADETVMFWDTARTNETVTLAGHGNEVNAVAFSPDGRRLASGSSDHTIKLWDPALGTEINTLTGHGDAVFAVAFSPRGDLLASCGGDGTIRLWAADTGGEIRSFRGRAQPTAIAFSPDGNRLASGHWNKTVVIWNTATGEKAAILDGHTDTVYAVAFSPDGRYIASGCGNDAVKLWDVNTGEEVLTLKGARWIRSVAFSPGGERLAAASSWYNTVTLWDTTTGQKLRTLSGHTSTVCSVVFSPDGQRLASGSFDKTIGIWDADAGKKMMILTGHAAEVHSVAFSPDGRRLASGDSKGTVKIWNTQSDAD